MRTCFLYKKQHSSKNKTRANIQIRTGIESIFAELTSTKGIIEVYLIYERSVAQPVVELVEWQTTESEVSVQIPGSILTSRTETSSLSRVERDGWDPSSAPVSGAKK